VKRFRGRARRICWQLLSSGSPIADPARHLPPPARGNRYEGACTTLLPARTRSGRFDGDAAALAIARIEAHYFVNQGFLGPNQLQTAWRRSATSPARSCRAATTSFARRSRPTRSRAPGRSRIRRRADAGHSVREPGITRELVAAVKRMQARVNLK
jgi:proline iminopeptidase